MAEGYRLPRYGANVESLLEKIEELEENFILVKDCGERWVQDEYGNNTSDKEFFWSLTYAELLEYMNNEKVVFMLFLDEVDYFPPSLATSSYSEELGTMVLRIEGIQNTRLLLLTEGSSGEIIVSAEEEIGGIIQEDDPIFTQWQQDYPNAADTPLTILEIDNLCN